VLKITPYEVMETRCRKVLNRSLASVHAECKRVYDYGGSVYEFAKKHPMAALETEKELKDGVSKETIAGHQIDHYLSYLFWLSDKPVYRVSDRVMDVIRRQPISFSRANYEPLDLCCYIAFDRGSVNGKWPVHGAYVHEEALLTKGEIFLTIMFFLESEYEREEVFNVMSYIPFQLPIDINTRITDVSISSILDPSVTEGDIVDVLRAYLLINKQSLPRRFSRHQGVDKPDRSCPCCGSTSVFHGLPADYRDIASTLSYYEVELLGGGT